MEEGMLGRSFKKTNKNLLGRQGGQGEGLPDKMISIGTCYSLQQSLSSEFQTCISCWSRGIIPNWRSQRNHTFIKSCWWLSVGLRIEGFWV